MKTIDERLADLREELVRERDYIRSCLARAEEAMRGDTICLHEAEVNLAEFDARFAVVCGS